jgi:hypothetical protein
MRAVGIVCLSLALAACGNGSSVDQLVSIQIKPSDPNIVNGYTTQLSATGIYSSGMQRDLTATATWSSTDTGIATVGNSGNGRGLVNPVALGTASILATSGSIAGQTKLTVVDRNELAYVQTDKGIEQYSIADDGSFRSLNPAVVGGTYETPVTHPSGHYLYALTLGPGTSSTVYSRTIAQFNIAADGTLRPMTPATVDSLQPCCDETVYLFGVDPGGHNLYADWGGEPGTWPPGGRYAIDSNGALAAPADYFVPDIVGIDASGSRALGIELGSIDLGSITVYSAAADGTFPATANAAIAYATFQSGPFALHQSGQYFYLCGAAGLAEYAIVDNGAQAALSPSFTLSLSSFGASCLGQSTLVIHPSGKFAYLLWTHTPNGYLADSVAVFSIDSQGRPAFLSSSPVSFGMTMPLLTYASLWIDPNGLVLGVLGPPDLVYEFAIAADGSLKPVPGSPITVGMNPRSISFTR